MNHHEAKTTVHTLSPTAGIITTHSAGSHFDCKQICEVLSAVISNSRKLACTTASLCFSDPSKRRVILGKQQTVWQTIY